MASAREVKLRIRSVKNISQVTRALQAVSASKVQKAMQAMYRTRPYATKAWQVLTHLADQPGRSQLHPLLAPRDEVKNTLVVLISGDRGLAGAYNTNIVRFTLQRFRDYPTPVRYITVGRKGRDMMIRRGQDILAEFSNLPAAPQFADVSAIGRLAVDEFLAGRADEVYLVYTDFVNMMTQVPTMKKLLPLEVDSGEERVETFSLERQGPPAAYIYEPGQDEILDEIVPRFTALQVYQAVMESLASEHAARMVAMKNATDNATELAAALQLQYNKARQQSITSEMLDIAGGAEALAKGG
ncbi:MAG: ATP synthase F1 subunit gamma [Anaerolineae bacterium]|nr:MAG: ATP synthase F1 subunit gamma [Anaerolineae bacterium]